jgi:aminomethyltransferase
MSQLKRTRLYEEHVRLGAKIVDVAGWEMPIEYTGISDEHKAVRTNIGLFDVSHMGEVIITGKDAQFFVQNLVSADISKLNQHQVVYTMMCYAHGGIVDDLLVYKYSTEKYLLVVNASNIEKDYAWMLENKADFEVEIKNKSAEYGQVALQGPNAQSLLQKLTKHDLSEIKFFHFAEIEVNGIPCIVSRTGYTGEDGFEIYSSSNDIVSIWQILLEVGKEFDLKPIALGARDTLRFEASLPLYGNEINKDITPLEAGLGFFVKLDTDFIGKEALAKQKEEGLKRKVVGLRLLKKGICRHGYTVCDMDKNEIGVITTGYLLPERDFSVALALIDIKEAELDNHLLVKIRNRYYEAVVTKKKFMDKKYKK